MKLKYNVLWIEDYPKDMKVQIGMIKEALNNKHLIPTGLELSEAYRSFDLFMQYLNQRNPNDFSDIDLILVDYNLSDPNLHTGINLVEALRNKNIYTDVIFYSGNINEALRKKKDYIGELDNVTYTDNTMDKFIPKFENILNKQLALIMQISDLRGYLMDSTSDFDFITRAYVQKFFPLLSADDKEYIYSKIEGCIDKQNKNETRKFKKITTKEHDYAYVKDAMDSLEYVMTVKDKIYIMSLILQKYKHETENYAENFANKYDEQIIKYRNKLAHNKLVYGQKQSGHIKIAKTLDDLACDCETCNAKLTREECEALREHIYQYYLFFNKLIED